ncbi:unnamed protein product [Durusdinium trenchii]|uniref:Uncharacterized protein n=1 Tax=Durusdinium trenchii TaxID=1381693 RepID=A0ABP0PCW5_9DINO
MVCVLECWPLMARDGQKCAYKAQARRQERLRQEQERKERLAREWAAITEWHAPMESWEELQLSLEDFRTQERAQMEEEVRRALRKTKGSRSRSKRKRSSSQS